jgi:hypothetical protein
MKNGREFDRIINEREIVINLFFFPLLYCYSNYQQLYE